MIDLPDDQLAIIRQILKQYIPGREIVVFGSRVRGRAKPYSDIDLCVMGDVPLEDSVKTALSEAFSESDLPIKVDIVDWATTQPGFRKIIEDQAVDLFSNTR
ncbi:MAG TPA: nucleotidyltransferase domain-containing protein [Micavibrio sp.]|jgi:predicted nucleotidyltransferase